MRTLITIVFLAIVAVVVVGYTQGWYTLSKDSDDHTTKIDITVDKDKIQEDKDKAKKKVEELEKKAKDKASEIGEKAKKDS